MDGVIEDQAKYIQERANPIDRLAEAHARDAIKGTKQDDEKFRQDMRDNTLEGKENYSAHVKEANVAPVNHRLSLIHQFDAREVVLLEKHRRHELTPIPE